MTSTSPIEAILRALRDLAPVFTISPAPGTGAIYCIAGHPGIEIGRSGSIMLRSVYGFGTTPEAAARAYWRQIVDGLDSDAFLVYHATGEDRTHNRWDVDRWVRWSPPAPVPARFCKLTEEDTSRLAELDALAWRGARDSVMLGDREIVDLLGLQRRRICELEAMHMDAEAGA